MFDGTTYEKQHDEKRLQNALVKVLGVMMDSRWRTLGEISRSTGVPESSASARLRDLRKERFGGFVVERRARDKRIKGIFEYRVLVNQH